MQYTLTSVVLSSVGLVSTVCLGKGRSFYGEKNSLLGASLIDDWSYTAWLGCNPKHSCVAFAMDLLIAVEPAYVDTHNQWLLFSFSICTPIGGIALNWSPCSRNGSGSCNP